MKVGGEGGDRGWDGWMASLTQWTWVWVSSRNSWWTGRPVMLGSAGHRESDMTEQLNWIDQLIVTFRVLAKKTIRFCSVYQRADGRNGWIKNWSPSSAFCKWVQLVVKYVSGLSLFLPPPSTSYISHCHVPFSMTTSGNDIWDNEVYYWNFFFFNKGFIL